MRRSDDDRERDDNWQLLKALCREAIALSAENRESLPMEPSADRKDLAIEVEQLLKISGVTVRRFSEHAPSAKIITPTAHRHLVSHAQLDSEVELLRLIRMNRLRAGEGEEAAASSRMSDDELEQSH